MQYGDLPDEYLRAMRYRFPENDNDDCLERILRAERLDPASEGGARARRRALIAAGMSWRSFDPCSALIEDEPLPLLRSIAQTARRAWQTFASLWRGIGARKS